ncbi:MAG: DUF4832 domain-containing protein [Bacteroidales bacterium]|nr:DUF4832 domain-containing protein [Bacteroidales bacterium]
MRRISRILFASAILPLLAASCDKIPDNPDPIPEEVLETVTYTASEENFPNPERGFYVGDEVHQANIRGIADASLRAARLQGRTLFLLEFYLTDYVATDIADDYLQTIRARFQSLRNGGCKCILRFCYSNGMDVSDKPWDAPLEQVLRHIEQVKPLIQEFYDVIMVVQAGFIGSWGEWYYTDNFKDNASRKTLMEALLAAVPEQRQIELRTPSYKMRLYGLTLADTITRAEAHLPTTKARLGGHNDCYVSSANDWGTFNNKNERAYWGAETLYTIMGGESCDVTEYCHCEGTERYNGALKDLAVYHLTYLNNGYHQGVLKRWREEGCMDEIKIRLGYRYRLEEGQFTKAPAAGKPFQVILKMSNDGFSPAQNPRDAELILADASGKVVKTWPLESDPRFWMPAQTTTINQTITLPEGLSGKMTLYLNLPDPCATLRSDPRFSIRLANEGTWQEETGFNTLYSFTI